MRLGTVTTARGDFAVRQQGRGKQDGMALVLLHGWPESSYCWEAVAEQLPESVHVIAPDLRGLGDSPRTPDVAAYAKDALAADILAILDALDLTSATVVGHDWGGIVAQEVAVAAPQRVCHLGISNIAVINNLATNRRIAAAGPSRFLWYQFFLQSELPEALLAGNAEPWVRHFLRAFRPEGFPQDVLAECVRCHSIPGTETTAANYYRQFGADAKRWQALEGHRFAMPAAYLYGNRDVVITPDHLSGVDDCFDDLEIAQIEAGHFVQDEQPAWFAEQVLALLAR